MWLFFLYIAYMRTTLFTIISILCVYTFAGAQTTWHQQSYEISFKIKNTGLSVNGTLGNLKTTLVFSPDHISTSSLKGSVDVGTINTGINARNTHLKKPEYFNVDTFKVIQISSIKLYVKGAQYAGLFDVTIKGVTKQIEIPFEFNQFADEAEFKASFPLNRRDFGVGGKSMLMADELTVNIDVKAKK